MRSPPDPQQGLSSPWHGLPHGRRVSAPGSKPPSVAPCRRPWPSNTRTSRRSPITWPRKSWKPTARSPPVPIPKPFPLPPPARQPRLPWMICPKPETGSPPRPETLGFGEGMMEPGNHREVLKRALVAVEEMRAQTRQGHPGPARTAGGHRYGLPLPRQRLPARRPLDPPPGRHRRRHRGAPGAVGHGCLL